MTLRPSTIQTTMASLSSPKPHTRTLDGSVFLQCETSVSQVSRGDIAFQKESKESLTRETEGKQREREERDGSVISVGESRKSRRNSTRSHSRQTHREFYSDERDLRKHLERRAQQAIHGENSVQRKLCSPECTTWRSRISNEEIQNTHLSSHNVRLNLKNNNYGWPINWHIKLNVREYTCVANWR